MQTESMLQTLIEDISGAYFLSRNKINFKVKSKVQVEILSKENDTGH